MARRKSSADERRERAEEARAIQASKDRLRSIIVLGVTVVAVVGLAALALRSYTRNQAEDAVFSDKVSQIGVSESAAACDPVRTTPTDQNQQHIAAPRAVTYADAPPSFGPHRPQAAPFDRRFYTSGDRPEVPELVHNLEHGYTILWYDQTIADDATQLGEVKAIADRYDDQRVRFIAAPWTASDGAAFPAGRHIALTRWSADASDPGDQTRQRGNWLYCGSVSGEAVAGFVATWPNAESPEPGIM